jgi:hypothetical protein
MFADLALMPTPTGLLMEQRRCLSIGGVSLGFTSSGLEIQLDQDHEDFVVHAASCDIQIGIDWTEQLSTVPGKQLFDSGSVWTLYEDGPQFVFDFITPVFGCGPYKRLTVDKDFRRGELLLVRSCFPDESSVHALEYPLDELLVTNWLSRGRGIEIHGCGLVDSEKGSYLFIGHSGAGKSTTTRLWDSLRDVRILSDDRIIVRGLQDQFYMYGTPWHGEAGFASPEKAPLSRIFVLEHGERNEIVPLPTSRAVAELFTRCFLPFHDPEALSSALSYLHTLTQSVPCYLFRFLPNSTAVEEVLNFDD